MSARRIGVSNLAWPASAEPAMLDLLAARGAKGVEVAPTRIAPWEALTDAALAGFRRRCADAGLSVSSLQAIFYQKPGAALLGEAPEFDAMKEHVRHVAGIAHALGARMAVFGAPKSRLRGPLAPTRAMQLGAERLRALGDLAAAGGLTLCMEPVPSLYGADFLNHAAEVVEIVARADHARVRAHLDTACVTLAGDDVAEAIAAAAPVLAHYHMAELQLGTFAAPACDHARAGAALNAVDYSGWVVIEMREIAGAEEAMAAIGEAITFARRHYG